MEEEVTAVCQVNIEVARAEPRQQRWRNVKGFDRTDELGGVRVGVWGAGKQEKWPLIFAETTGRMMVFAGELGG